LITDAKRSSKPGNGETLLSMAQRINSGMVQLGGSDTLLTTPDLQAIAWLPMVLFKLFPTSSWKRDISIFAAEQTENNLGIIWGNIAADPTIYEGAKPSPSAYTYSDTPVSLALNNYWLQPMLWTPLSMHVLRYDQMATGWEQGLTKLNSTIDNALIYSLLAIVPTASKVFTSGSSFNIAASTDIDAFLLNTAFTGALAAPLLKDFSRIEQLFVKQNYNFDEGLRYVAVNDATMDHFISNDDKVMSLLTRWVTSDNVNLVGWKNAEFRKRSQVGIYDPVTKAIIDPTGSVPSTSVGANLSFIPDQVGIGIGKFDVFMVQVPTSYGYEMSADVRMGINALRSDYKGIASLIFQEPAI
jgi:hypothetical protein